MLLSHF